MFTHPEFFVPKNKIRSSVSSAYLSFAKNILVTCPGNKVNREGKRLQLIKIFPTLALANEPISISIPATEINLY